jgi:hypothetical protein
MLQLTGVITFCIETEMLVSLAVIQALRTFIDIYTKQYVVTAHL